MQLPGGTSASKLLVKVVVLEFEYCSWKPTVTDDVLHQLANLVTND